MPASPRLLSRREAQKPDALLRRAQPSENHGRGFYAVLTPAGFHRLHAAHAAHVDSIHLHFVRKFSEGDLRILYELFRRLTA